MGKIKSVTLIGTKKKIYSTKCFALNWEFILPWICIPNFSSIHSLKHILLRFWLNFFFLEFCNQYKIYFMEQNELKFGILIQEMILYQQNISLNRKEFYYFLFLSALRIFAIDQEQDFLDYILIALTTASTFILPLHFTSWHWSKQYFRYLSTNSIFSIDHRREFGHLLTLCIQIGIITDDKR